MDTGKLSSGTCPVGRALAHVGDTWSVLILRDVALGMRRFDQLQKNLGIAPNILTRRLAALTAAGVLERRRYSQRPPRDEYVLTDSGRDFLPVLHVLGAWARKHHGEGALSELVDTATGDTIDAVVIDGRTGRSLADLAVTMVPPPGSSLSGSGTAATP